MKAISSQTAPIGMGGILGFLGNVFLTTGGKVTHKLRRVSQALAEEQTAASFVQAAILLGMQKRSLLGVFSS